MWWVSQKIATYPPIAILKGRAVGCWERATGIISKKKSMDTRKIEKLTPSGDEAGIIFTVYMSDGTHTSFPMERPAVEQTVMELQAFLAKLPPKQD